MTSLLLDTHIWVWLTSAQPNLKPSVLDALELASASDLLFLSPISMWEIALKHSRGKMSLDRPVRDWLIHAATLPGLNLAPITPSIAAECAELPPAFHGDPADRILAATARSEGLTLVTHDKALILLAKQGYFKVLAT
ncbi:MULTISPECIES: type II toxin-antitoxin system VapC family toxin [Acidobacteriaceae]|uniref:type II toxin-antitoxin system VapC family toxin n=1 Tax=Acidobacteriaceae TaxID=204434 RepID=UPI00131AF67A|nr:MULTISPECIES: type II toxin-antitoxin system VapC family toxin [Acidobacteriaceae]MDW5264500.1 type II toxin-antitoxin system VapC family toxin [Edaphobacter sp.]